MPLIQQGGLMGKKAGLQGIEVAAERFMAGYQARKQQARDDVMIIWQMAQDDPSILEKDETKRTFRIAGVPMPSQGPGEKPILIRGPAGEESLLFYPSTKQVRSWSDLMGRKSQIIEGDNEAPPLDKQGQEGAAAPTGRPWWKFWGGSPQGAPAGQGSGLTGPPPPSLGELAMQAQDWLEPAGPSIPTTKPAAKPQSSFLNRLGASARTPFPGVAMSPSRGRPAPAAKKPPTNAVVPQPPQAPAPRPEFQAIWPRLSEQDRAKVRSALQNGYAPAEILAAIQGGQ